MVLKIQKLQKLEELEKLFEPYYEKFKEAAKTLPIVADGKLLEVITEFAKLRTPEGRTPRNHTMAVFTELIVRVRAGVPYRYFIADIKETILRPGTPYDVTIMTEDKLYRVEVKSSQTGDYLLGLEQVCPGCPAETLVTADLRPYEEYHTRIECFDIRNSIIDIARERGTIKEPSSNNFKGKKKVAEKEDFKDCEESQNHPVTKALGVVGMSPDKPRKKPKTGRNKNIT